jgi:hypothetical protein
LQSANPAAQEAIPQTPIVHDRTALGSLSQGLAQPPQWSGSLFTSAQAPAQHSDPAWQGWAAEQPAAQVPSGPQIDPAAHCESVAQPAHWCVVVLQISGAMQSVSAVQPTAHVFEVLSQYCPSMQGSLSGRHATHWPEAGSQTGVAAFVAQSTAQPPLVPPPRPPSPPLVAVAVVPPPPLHEAMSPALSASAAERVRTRPKRTRGEAGAA